MQWNNDIAVGLTAVYVVRSLASIWQPIMGVIINIASDLGLIALINACTKRGETFETQSFKPVTYSLNLA